tara:strand:- start:57 stop:500 length:444 start_codon:yes stop_codon:yes gene_type:complete
MLLKKILHLKKKAKKYKSLVIYLNNIIETNKKSQEDIQQLKKEINSLKRSEDYYKAEMKKQRHTLNNTSTAITSLKEYKEVCARDIPILASAVTDLYNLINFAFDGQLLKNKDEKESDEDLPLNEDFDDYFDKVDDSCKKKNKKIYH